MIAVHNSSGQPQVVTTSGRVLGAGEFGAYDRDARLSELLDAGVLVEVEGKPGAGTDPQASKALKEVAKANAAAEQEAASTAADDTPALKET